MNTPPVDRKSLVLLHAALVMGCALFLGVAFFLWQEGTVPLALEVPVPSFIGVVAAAVLVPLSFPVFRTVLAHNSPAATPEGLLGGIRAACIAQWAVVEAACFLNTVLFLLRADLLALGTAVFVLAVLIALAPTRKRWERWISGGG